MKGRLRDAHRELLATLEQHDVAFVVLGGVALQLRGWAGDTADVDIAVAPAGANVERLDAALGALDAKLAIVGANGTAFDTRLGRLDIVNQASAVGGYDGWAAGASRVEIDSALAIEVAGAEDIERSKTAAGRPKDLEQLAGIRRDLIAAGELDPERTLGPSAPPPKPPGDLPAGHADQLLGPRPAGGRPARQWDALALAVADYRERYQIASDDPLGPPATGEQARARARLERLTERFLEPDDLAPDPG